MNGPRIILFDLEILANLDEAYKIWPSLGNYPGLTLKADINSIICFGWKVYGEDGVNCINAWDFKTRWKKNINDDYALCKKILEVLEDADAFVFHNGKGFDLPFLLTRLELNGLPTIPPHIKHIDTKILAKKLFFFSKGLNHLGKTLVKEQKLEHGGWDLWPKVMKKDPEAMKLMEDYCKQDVLLMEKIFERLKKFGKLPNFGAWTDGLHRECPNCGNTKLINKGIAYRANARNKQRYVCTKCGTNSYELIKAPKAKVSQV